MSVTILIIVVTCLVSYKGFNDRSFFEQLKHHPHSESKNGEWYRMISSGFLHADWMHLGFNMFVFYNFGEIIESLFVSQFGTTQGRTVYLLFYLAIIVLSSFPTFIKHKDNYGYGAIGASGAVSGILFVFILLQPWEMLYLLFIPIPIPAVIFGILYLAYSSWASKNAKDNIGHDAHFYGAIFGMIISIILIPGIFPTFIQRFSAGLPF